MRVEDIMSITYKVQPVDNVQLIDKDNRDNDRSRINGSRNIDYGKSIGIFAKLLHDKMRNLQFCL